MTDERGGAAPPSGERRRSRSRVFRARRILVDATTCLEGGGLEVAGGRIVRLLDASRLRRASTSADLGDVLVTPGWVNAHAHLELTDVGGPGLAMRDFGAWVRAVMSARAGAGPEALARAARRGADVLLAGGTTAIGDIDTAGGGLAGLDGHPALVVLYRELIDAYDPERTRGALDSVRRALPRRARRREGLSPHAPFTASPALLAAVARIARRRRAPVTVHWAETREETRWLGAGEGPLAALLGPSPRRSGLDLLDGAGLLGPGLSLVHGNWPEPGDPERLAAAGVVLVHCPGTHRWFEREPFPLERYLAAGVTIALGTDSAASNDALDLGAEARRMRAAFPALRPAVVWAMGTVHGARALGLADEVGALRPGFRADWVVRRDPGGDPDEVLDALTRGDGAPLATWTAGRESSPAGGRAPGA